MTNPNVPVDEDFLTNLATYEDIRNMKPVIMQDPTLVDVIAQRLSSIGSISSAAQVEPVPTEQTITQTSEYIYTPEDHAYFDGLGFVPVD